MKIFYLIIYLSAISIFAQKSELGKVTVEQLSEKEHPIEKEAEAAFLFNNCNISMEYYESNGFVLTIEVESKIKIYNKEGYDFANFSVPLYHDGSSVETIEIKDAITYNLVNGKIEKTKLKKEGEFTEKLNKYRSLKKVTMPNISEGSIVEYRYIVRSPYLGNVPDWYFQKKIPVNSSALRLRIPEYFIFKTNMKGYLTPSVKKDSKEKTFDFTDKQRNVGISTVSTSFSQNKLSFKEDITLYELTSVPSLKSEKFVNNINNYTSSISHELNVIKYPNQTPKLLSTSWEDVTKNIYDNDNFGGELKRTGYFEKEIDPKIQSISDTNEKISFLFDYVKSNIKWNETYGYYCDEGVRNAFKTKTGNVAEINLMLTAMLRSSGINANPVLISTRSHGIPVFPSRSAFNYVICAVEIENSLILLDATDINAIPNILPLRALNWTGRLIRKDGSSTFVDLIPSRVSRDNFLLNAKLDTDGKVSGKVMRQMSDYMAYVQRNNYAGLKIEQYQERIENRYNGIDIENLEHQNLSSDYQKPVAESYDFIDDKHVELIGDKIYFSPMLFFVRSENPFMLEQREYPIDFTFPLQDKYNITIELPEGYEVESLPKSISFAITDNMTAFKYVINLKENKIQLLIQEDINAPIISPVHYEDLKSFYQNVVDKQNEKIVLKKI